MLQWWEKYTCWLILQIKNINWKRLKDAFKDHVSTIARNSALAVNGSTGDKDVTNHVLRAFISATTTLISAIFFIEMFAFSRSFSKTILWLCVGNRGFQTKQLKHGNQKQHQFLLADMGSKSTTTYEFSLFSDTILSKPAKLWRLKEDVAYCSLT